MMQPVYILSACAISPQQSFEPSAFLTPVMTSDNGKMYVREPDYRQFVNPVAIRRMSRQLKMGITAGIRALQLAHIQTPDAIITGTGLGSITDMERFLTDMISLKEAALNPTFFIQSTYNSINGWIALQSKSTGYNQTFVHRGFSMELSLLDAQLFLNENEEKKYALAGCFDELTDSYFFVKNKIHYWKKKIPLSTELLKNNNTPGTIAGEGAAFFTLSNEKINAVCTLHAVGMIQHPEQKNFMNAVNDFLSEQNLGLKDIHLLITGMNGDANFQPFYTSLLENISPRTTVAAFKHLIGEYPTATGFALWLAVHIFTTQNIPEEIIFRKGSSSKPEKLLIVNHYIQNSFSLILLST